MLKYANSRAQTARELRQRLMIRISDISWACGFSDPSHFARRFRKHFGSSPGDYRKVKD